MCFIRIGPNNRLRQYITPKPPFQRWPTDMLEATGSFSLSAQELTNATDDLEFASSSLPLPPRSSGLLDPLLPEVCGTLTSAII